MSLTAFLPGAGGWARCEMVANGRNAREQGNAGRFAGKKLGFGMLAEDDAARGEETAGRVIMMEGIECQLASRGLLIYTGCGFGDAATSFSGAPQELHHLPFTERRHTLLFRIQDNSWIPGAQLSVGL